MSETMLTPRSALANLMKPGRHGDGGNAPAGVTVSERSCVLVKVLARNGRAEEVGAAVARTYGITLPRRPEQAGNDDLSFVWSGPDQWLAVAEPSRADLASELAELLHGLAAVTDQSHGFTVLRLAGPRVLDTLMKGAVIDLDPRSFSVHAAALTVVSHIGVQLWMADAAPTCDIAVFRSFAASFWHWLEEAALEFGLEVMTGGR